MFAFALRQLRLLSPPSSSMPGSERSRWQRHPLALLATLVAGAASCSEVEAPPAPALELRGEASAVLGLLQHCASFSRGALPRRCAEAAARLSEPRPQACSSIRGACPIGELCELVERLQCAAEPTDAAGTLPVGSFRFTGPLGVDRGAEAGEFVVSGTVDRAHVAADLSLRHFSASTRSTALWPADAAPWLRTPGALLHARWRSPGGLPLAAPLAATEVDSTNVAGAGSAFSRPGAEETLGGASPAGASMADRLYGLRNQLFSRTVLDGTVELVLFPPREGGEFPQVALALGFRVRALAVAAMESYLDDMQAQWPFRRRALQLGEWSGTCVENLSVLPELAPCYVATQEALVLGWNRRSLERVLAPGGATATETPLLERWEPLDAEGAAPLEKGSTSAAEMVPVAALDFGRLAVANERLARARGAVPGVPGPDFAFAHATLQAARPSEGVARLYLELRGESP